MTRVNGSDHVLLLLRERLQKMERDRSGTASRAARGRGVTPGATQRLQALAGIASIPPDEFKRTLVRALLSEEMGDGVANDPDFQSVADDVFRVISESEEGRALIDRAAQALRAKA